MSVRPSENHKGYGGGHPAVVLINTGKVEAFDRLSPLVSATSIVVVTEKAYASLYPSGADLRFVEDVGDVVAVLKRVLEIEADRGVLAVVSPSERSMPAGGYVRSYLSLPGVPNDVANLLTNKVAMKSRLRAAGLPVADFVPAVGKRQLRESTDELGFPVIVKPALGTGSMNTHVLRDPIDLEKLLDSPEAAALVGAPRLLAVESFLPVSAELTCDGIVVDGDVRFCITSRYNAPLIGGIGGMLGASVIDPDDRVSDDLRRLHRDVVMALGVTDAVTHLEVLQVGEKLYVGEIACRPGGAGVVDGARLATGVDLWDAFMRLSLGLTIEVKTDGLSPTPVMWTTLPTAPGRIVSVSTAADFAHIDGVRHVDMHVVDGDVVSSRMHSSTTTGIVYLDVPMTDRATIADRLTQVRVAYRLTIDGQES